MSKKPLELNIDFENILNLLERNDSNYFITGKAGVGKSTLLHLFRKTTRKKTVVLAPTGIAALNVGGQTIHSFFNFPPKFMLIDEIKKARDKRIYKSVEVIVIDEISMVRADMLDNIDYFLRLNREKYDLPFGGVQMIFFGDLFQLPPVVATLEERGYLDTNYHSPFFFSARVLTENKALEMIELCKVYRQEARRFIRLLDSVRLGCMDFDDVEEFNDRCDPSFHSNDFYITLSARNSTVNAINLRQLKNIDAPEVRYIGKITGIFEPKQSPVEIELQLKVGAQVMFCKNDPNKEYANGTIGRIKALSKSQIMVEIISDASVSKVIEVELATWEIIRYKAPEMGASSIESHVVGSLQQYPLRLAWAITIHKSQGKTFDKVIIDLEGGAFEHGQTYVALSRCKTLEGIILRRPLLPQDIIVDERIIDFYQQSR